MRRVFLLALAAALVAGLVTAPATHAAPRPDAVWTEAHFNALTPPITVHADVLRPANLPPNAKTPVVVSVGPYFNYAAGLSDPNSYNPTGEPPSARFYDFLDLSRLLERGYTFVMVDLPGFGGSGGCTDWGGPSEQAVTHAAVEWAASQPWSTGKVALFGKSYDAATGLIGVTTRPRGLAAVVAMEPLESTYRYLYSHGVRYPNSVGTPALYQGIAALPGPLTHDPGYTAGSVPNVLCDAPNFVTQVTNDDENSAFWRARNLALRSGGSTVPLFLTQGLLEANTKPEASVFEFFNGLKGPNRAWFGQFDHVRGWERNEDRTLKTGRPGFIDEVMRFLDLHLKGIKPTVVDPTIVVQDFRGRYRAEQQWPPADAKTWWTPLRAGTYTDDALALGITGATAIWSISQPLPYTVWMTGSPVVEFDVAGPARANLVAFLYDIGPDGAAVPISRAARLLRQGTEKGSLKMWAQDWPVAAGHRLGLQLSGTGVPQWLPVPTLGTVTVKSARLGLPALSRDRTQFIQGAPTQRIADYTESQLLSVDAATIAGGATSFVLPPPLAAAAPTRAQPAPAKARPQVLAVTGGSALAPLLLLLASAAAGLAARRSLRAR